LRKHLREQMQGSTQRHEKSDSGTTVIEGEYVRETGLDEHAR
jgi:hypothetical protein